MVLESLVRETTADDIHRLQAIVYARDAAQKFKDGRFLDLARQCAETLPSDIRQSVLTDLEKTAAEIRPFLLPDYLLQQLQENIQSGHEQQLEDTVNQLGAVIMDTCLRLIELWEDPPKAASWLHHTIIDVDDKIRQAAKSISQRSLVHDAIGTVTTLKSYILLTIFDQPEDLEAARQGHPQPLISENLDFMVKGIGLMHKHSVRLTDSGFQEEYLNTAPNGRALFVILRNLVGNARQHPNNGQGPVDVHLTLTQSVAGATITVADNGAGMTAETVTHLLTGRPMHDGHTVDHANPNEFHGFGWLRIREACAKLGIVPEINSTPGQGTTVTLHLPQGLLKSDTPRTAAEETNLLNRFLRAAVLDRVLLKELTTTQIGPYDPILDRLTTERRTPDVLRAVARFRLQHQLPGISLPADLSTAATADALFAQGAPLFWKTMLALIAAHPSRDMRRFAVDMVDAIAPHITAPDRLSLTLFITAALRDSDATVVLKAWHINHAEQVVAPHLITEDWLNWRTPESSPQFGLARYVFGTASDHFMRRETLNPIMATSTTRESRIDLRSVQPMHSLADFNPNDAQRKSVLHGKMERLHYLLKTFGTARRDEILMLFTFEEGNGNIEVLQLPSGHRLMMDGHHRSATLLRAAQDGLIPESWLQIVPATVFHYTGDMPEFLVRRLATLGATLTWEDLLPHDRHHL